MSRGLGKMEQAIMDTMNELTVEDIDLFPCKYVIEVVAKKLGCINENPTYEEWIKLHGRSRTKYIYTESFYRSAMRAIRTLIGKGLIDTDKYIIDEFRKAGAVMHRFKSISLTVPYYEKGNT